MKNADLDESLPEERALGIFWDIDKDTFKFKINLTKKPIRCRGMLSVINSIYDPLGFVAPYTLKGKKLLQQLCWDEFRWGRDDPPYYPNPCVCKCVFLFVCLCVC